MPRFDPFRAWRYADADRLAELIAPPYDVLSEDEIAALAARSPHNIVHVDDPRGEDRYRRAGDLFRRWCADGVLVRDDRPSFTVYRLGFTDATGADREISGVLGGLEVLDPGVDGGAGRVLPHERTTPKASTDRLELTRATRANLSPVWGLSLATGLSAALADPGQPVGEVLDQEVDGGPVRHRVERIDDPDRVAAIAALLAADDVLIADGHHRYGVAREYRDERRAVARPDSTEVAAAERTLAFVNELAPEQLSVEAIHRLYRGVGPDALRAALDRRFVRDPLPAGRPGDTDPSADAALLAAMAADGFLVLLGPDGAERLTPRPGAFEGVRALDGLWLEESLADLAGLEVDYQHGVAQVRAAVADGRAVAAVLIRPVGVAEIERTAREGLLMPPKSTFFTPKLKTGLLVRPLD